LLSALNGLIEFEFRRTILSKTAVSTEFKYRLVTRSDFDGLVCAVLLKELNLIDDIKFVHPKDMQDGVC